MRSLADSSRVALSSFILIMCTMDATRKTIVTGAMWSNLEGRDSKIMMGLKILSFKH